jgi:tetratricopeptide (TPR) repeat protein
VADVDVASVLAENGPMTEEQLIAALVDRGVDLGDHPELALNEMLEAEDLVLPVSSDRWVAMPALLAGRMFTHRLTTLEVEHDLLDVSPDLDPVMALAEDEAYQRLTDGASVVPIYLPDDIDALVGRDVPPLDADGELEALLLPPGYLRDMGLNEGDVIALRVSGDGLGLEAVPELDVPAQRLAELGRRLGAVLEAKPDEPEELEMAIWTACADDPTLFTEPLPPLGEALDACGLVVDDDWVAMRGFDFQQWRLDKRCALLAWQYDLTDDEALEVLGVLTLYHQAAEVHSAALEAFEDGGAAGLAAFTAELADQASHAEPSPAPLERAEFRAAIETTLSFLAEPNVAEAVLADTIGAGSEGAAALGMFAEMSEPQAPREAWPALRWLRGKAHERLGDVTRAEAAYQAAESIDPDWSPALLDLARYASDRGDAARGLALLRRAGVAEDYGLVEVLEAFQVGPRPDIGRNQPCWCGSGRKYKKCHLHHEQRPLEDRASWLYQKAARFLLDDPRWRHAMIEAAYARAQFDEDEDASLDSMSDPLIIDAVLFEGGAFADFVTIRGGLLPDDERLMAEQWLLIERSLYEIEHVRRGEGLTLRDVRTGDIHQVRERSASQTLPAGMLICTRVMPAGDTTQIFGGVEPVALHQRDELIALLDSKPDVIDLVSFLTRRFAPPVLQNTEGDPLVLCEATLRIDAPDALTAELDETYQRADDGSTEWIEFVTTDGMQRVRATLNLDGHELTVRANSDARIDRVLNTLRTLDPTLTIVNQSRRPARDTREAAALATGEAPAAPLDPTEPEIAAALDAFMRDYEQKWLDLPIPALAGHTPRQAAADPTRRGDLIRLLDTFPSRHDNPGVMDPDRLRADLDLR